MTLHRRLLLIAVVALSAMGWASDVSAPEAVSAESFVVMDAGTGKMLWSYNADAPRFPASTTKIMTGMLLVEHCTPDDVITAPADIATVKEASMHLKPGERVRAKDMLYAIMLRSANDGCYATAIHIAGSVPKFAEMMNERAKQIGCTGTHFANPNGLHDPDHYTTAHDLALIGREAMKYEWFRETVRTYKTKINRSINWKDTWMINHDKWLKKDASADGIKTGWTIPAGRCFVGSATRNGWRVITVVMKSKNWQEDHGKLLNWAFGKFAPSMPIKAGEVVGRLSLKGGMVANLSVAAGQDAYTVAPKNQATTAARRIEALPNLSAPIVKGQRVGDIVLQDPDGFEQRIPAVATSDVAMAPVAAVTGAASDPSKWIAGGGLIAGLTLLRSRSRRSKLYGKSTARTRIF